MVGWVAGAAGRVAESLAVAVGQLPFPVDFSSDYVRRAGFTALVIDVLALVSVWRSRAHSLKARLVWTAIVALFPVLGAVAWFVLGREKRDSPARRV